MAHSIVTWLNTPDTWEVSEQNLTSFEVKYMVKSSNKIQILSESNEWIDLGITGNPTSAQFLDLGMDDIMDIPEGKWAELERPVEILTWTDDEDTASVDIEYEYYDFIAPRLELTVPEYTLADSLERPLKLLTYTDGVEVPVVKTEYNLKGVGTRIMKRGE